MTTIRVALLSIPAVLLLNCCASLTATSSIVEATAQVESTPGTTAELATPTPLSTLDFNSEAESIRLRMLHGHETWQTIWIQLDLIMYPPEDSEDPVHLQRLQVWIQQPAQVLMLSGSWGDTDPDNLFISNGTNWVAYDVRARQTQEGEIPASVFQPFNSTLEMSGMAFSYPLADLMGYPAIQAIFPAALALRPGTYRVIGEDTISGRAALVVEFIPPPPDTMKEHLSIDILTGLVLHQELFDTSGGNDYPVSELSVYGLYYDPAFDPAVFLMEIPENVYFQDGPQWTVTSDPRPQQNPQ